MVYTEKEEVCPDCGAYVVMGEDGECPFMKKVREIVERNKRTHTEMKTGVYDENKPSSVKGKIVLGSCAHCEFIDKVFPDVDALTPREYWIMTEIFVYLHGRKDYCKGHLGRD